MNRLERSRVVERERDGACGFFRSAHELTRSRRFSPPLRRIRRECDANGRRGAALAMGDSMNRLLMVWVLAIAATVSGGPETAGAEPLVAIGIGTSNCGKVAADLNPGQGFRNPVNLMLYAWVQGYLSAANVSLLERDSRHVDLAGLDQNTAIALVLTYCRANPGKRPADAVDNFLRNSLKKKAGWEPGTVKWDE
jgi:hypothetical protein